MNIYYIMYFTTLCHATQFAEVEAENKADAIAKLRKDFGKVHVISVTKRT